MAVDATMTFYGDDTEFSNPFRVGQTLLGTSGRLFLDTLVNDRLSIRAGVFVNRRFGSAKSVDEVRPVLTMVLRGENSTWLFGTLDTMTRMDGPGPDRTGPHALLPPVQRETLAFDRPYEAGMQWIVRTPRLRQDAWINWQRVASATERELFDVGLATRTRVHRALTLRGDLHIVHQGGQLGGRDLPVADSGAATGGVEVGGPAGRFDRMSLEALVVVARNVPDRGKPELTSNGVASFYRAAAETRQWRVHLILWRATRFVKVEGDAIYQSVLHDGTRYGGLRDYGELGLTRIWPLAQDSWLEASIRWHRIETDDDLSVRVLGVTHLRWRVR
jgi:hypothetical protein